MKKDYGKLLSIGIIINGLASCADPTKSGDFRLLSQIQSCSGNAEYTTIEFDFIEEWMTKYTFGVERSRSPVGPLGIGGITFGETGDQPVLVRMFDEEKNCILQVESFTLQASSIELFANTFGGQTFGSSALKSFELARQSQKGTSLFDIIHVGVTVKSTEDTQSYLSFAVLANEIL